jgi:hypothetical protein
MAVCAVNSPIIAMNDRRAKQITATGLGSLFIDPGR